MLRRKYGDTMDQYWFHTHLPRRSAAVETRPRGLKGALG